MMPTDAPAVLRLGDDSFIEELRRQLVRFAALRLQDFALAEDVAHEAIVGALKNAAPFSGRSALKTWVIAILKYKIADSLRQKHRQVEVTYSFQETATDEDFSAFFDDGGYWRPDERPANWENPEAMLREKQFRQVLEACLNSLPPQQAKVFMLREFFELETADICNSLEISVSNFHVTLHRAKLRLRASLEKQWHSASS